MARTKRYNPETGAWEYADEAFVSGGGGVSSWNGLTDKPFYEESGEVEILAEQEITLPMEDGVPRLVVSPAPFVLTVGDTYRVILDDAEYVLTCELYEGVLALSHIVTDETSGDPAEGSFLVGYIPQELAAEFNVEDDAVMLVIFSEDLTHTAALYHNGSVIKTIDVKFLPMDAIDARIDAYIEEALGGDY